MLRKLFLKRTLARICILHCVIKIINIWKLVHYYILYWNKNFFLLSWHFWNYLYKFSLTLLTFLELFVSKCQRVCYYKSKVAQKKVFWVFLYYQKYGIFWSKFIENKLLISGKLLIHNFFLKKKIPNYMNFQIQM